MTNPNLTEIVVVLDRSGSMSSVRDDTIGGFNSFIEDQKKHPGECRVTLTQFDNVYEVVYGGRRLANVPPLTEATYVPRGSTALLDAVGRTINEVGARLHRTREEERPGKVLFVIITDGEENASREFRLDKIKDMIKEQTEKYSWTFVFLGADQDKFQGESMGIAKGNVFNYAQGDTKGALQKMSIATDVYRCMDVSEASCCANFSDIMDSGTPKNPDALKQAVDEVADDQQISK